LDGISKESSNLAPQDALPYFRANLIISDKFRPAGHSMQPQCAVAEEEVRTPSKDPELKLNLLTVVDILNEHPNQSLQFAPTHIYLIWPTQSTTRV
jgi:hypothetical protein